MSVVYYPTRLNSLATSSGPAKHHRPCYPPKQSADDERQSPAYIDMEYCRIEYHHRPKHTQRRADPEASVDGELTEE